MLSIPVALADIVFEPNPNSDPKKVGYVALTVTRKWFADGSPVLIEVIWFAFAICVARPVAAVVLFGTYTGIAARTDESAIACRLRRFV
jgi:hypothetical protein